MKVKIESEVAQSCRTLATPWTAAYQAPPSMGFSRQKYWSGVPLPSMMKVTMLPIKYDMPSLKRKQKDVLLTNKSWVQTIVQVVYQLYPKRGTAHDSLSHNVYDGSLDCLAGGP